MFRDKYVVKKKYSFTMTFLIVVAFLVIISSFAVSLSRFVDFEPPEASSTEDETFSVSTQDVATHSVEDVEEIGGATNTSLDSIRLTKILVTNSSVRDGSLALIDSPATGSLDDSELVPIHSSRTGKYDLKDYSLRLRKDAIENIDRFIMSFYLKYKNNGLGIADGYVSSASGNERDLVTGYSVKFTTYKTSNSLSDEDFNYLKEQSFKYGVIQRYPAGKIESTGSSEDLSIYRYVGLVHSCYMNHYDLSLEEYVDKIKTEKVVEYRNKYESDSLYIIYYVPINSNKDTTYIEVPSDEKYTYTVSGDGTDGFIITARIS